LVTGKGLGGGMPIGAFTASELLMDLLSDKPKLGHITTFGGNPVIASAALATLEEITQTNIIPSILEKEKLIKSILAHPLIKEIRGKGLMLAIMLESEELANYLVLEAQARGLILFWLLFEKKAIRITPPLTITQTEIRKGCDIIMSILNDYKAN
jgi:acetylornithine/succinyldiaminopimelate/putrescine aminotransferase